MRERARVRVSLPLTRFIPSEFRDLSLKGEVFKFGAKGGGRADMAQAGLTPDQDPQKILDAIEAEVTAKAA